MLTSGALHAVARLLARGNIQMKILTNRPNYSGIPLCMGT